MKKETFAKQLLNLLDAGLFICRAWRTVVDQMSRSLSLWLDNKTLIQDLNQSLVPVLIFQQALVLLFTESTDSHSSVVQSHRSPLTVVCTVDLCAEKVVAN